jgi:hypothetical protein
MKKMTTSSSLNPYVETLLLNRAVPTDIGKTMLNEENSLPQDQAYENDSMLT